MTKETNKTKKIEFTKMNIYQKINYVKKHDLSVKRNTQAYNYKYATLDQIQKKLNPILTEVGLIITHYIKDRQVITKIINIDNPDEFLESVIEMKDGLNPQQKGSEITYYRRYNVMSMLDLEVEDDDGQAASKKDINKSKTNNNNNNDEKPWYNDFDKHKDLMIKRIEQG